ncbi:hypothetical protein E3N88_43446 [Mikania micrantha]|uniref:J domain-containing protein n=1 Tax=Mikania micrantha TaxID=192012 RepID=A0A5N6LEV9_9ASTR|nr:hypothetical protein E3N88_43446 [Mikania micrantha]
MTTVRSLTSKLFFDCLSPPSHTKLAGDSTATVAVNQKARISWENKDAIEDERPTITWNWRLIFPCSCRSEHTHEATVNVKPLHIANIGQRNQTIPSLAIDAGVVEGVAVAGRGGSSIEGVAVDGKKHRCGPVRLLFLVNSLRDGNEDQSIMSVSYAYQVLDVMPDCTLSDLKTAFRAKVKQFHPDVRRSDENSSDAMIRLVIQAYEVHILFLQLSSECLDPFDAPECEAFDIFVNEVLCVGKGCPYSCVKTAPHAFTFSSSTGTAHATSQGHGEDYQVQLAVGQCPRSCIHYVTPSQRVILEELLGSILNMPFDCSAEAELLYSLIVKAKYENNRYTKPKKKPNVSTKHVDWY